MKTVASADGGDRLAEIEGRLERSAQWVPGEDVHIGRDGYGCPVCGDWGRGHPDDETFIGHAPDDVRWLVEKIKQFRKEQDEIAVGRGQFGGCGV